MITTIERYTFKLLWPSIKGNIKRKVNGAYSELETALDAALGSFTRDARIGPLEQLKLANAIENYHYEMVNAVCVALHYTVKTHSARFNLAHVIDRVGDDPASSDMWVTSAARLITGVLSHGNVGLYKLVDGGNTNKFIDTEIRGLHTLSQAKLKMENCGYYIPLSKVMDFVEDPYDVLAAHNTVELVNQLQLGYN